MHLLFVAQKEESWELVSVFYPAHTIPEDKGHSEYSMKCLEGSAKQLDLSF